MTQREFLKQRIITCRNITEWIKLDLGTNQEMPGDKEKLAYWEKQLVEAEADLEQLEKGDN